MNLTQSNLSRSYKISAINTTDQEMKDFLFTLGCYPGEQITVISQIATNYVINVKNSRYSIDEDLAYAIEISSAETSESASSSPGERKIV